MPRRTPSRTLPAARFGDEVLALLSPLYGTAFRLARDRAAAEDLVQDTLVKALGARDRFEAGTNLKAWLFAILHNTWRNRLRDAGRARVDVDSGLVDGAAALGAGAAADTPESLMLRDSLDVDLQAALDELPEHLREAVWLRDVDELSYAEIARVLDVPPGTVMSRISRGRRGLFERLTGRTKESGAPAPAAGGGGRI